MGQLTDDQLRSYTFDDLLRMSLVELSGRGLVLFDLTGQDSHLPHRSTSNAIEKLLHDAKKDAAIIAEIQSLKTSKALGTFNNYVWEYADVSSDPDFLPWSVVGGSRPANDSQIILYVNGRLHVSYKVSQTGIAISESLTSGQVAEAYVLSEALKSSHLEFEYDGDSGLGAGNLVWQIHNLGEDNYGNTPPVPGSSTKVWVMLNGVKQAQGVGINIVVGSGTATVTFLNDVDPDFEITDDDLVSFIIWRS